MRQLLNCCHCLFHFNLLVLFFFCLRRQTLPWQPSFDKVHENHADLFKVITSRLLNAHVRVKRRIPCSPRQLLIVLVAYVATSPRIFESLGKSKVNHIDYVLLLADTDEEVIWFDVSVKEAALVDVLDTLEHLDGKHQDGLQAEFTSAVLVEIFKRWSQ